MNMIVAADKNWAIGKDNSLLVVIPSDQKTFRSMTLGHPVVMEEKLLRVFREGFLWIFGRTSFLPQIRSFIRKG